MSSPPRRRVRGWRAASAALGLLALTGAGVLAATAAAPGTVGTVPEAAASGPVPLAFAPVTPATGDGPDAEAAPPADTSEEVARPDQPPVVAPAPVGLRVERFGIDAAVVPVGLEPDGAMELPDQVDRIGWFEPGVTPGASGSAVLAGHVDDRVQGRGALFEIGRLVPDDVVEVVLGDDTVQRWRVVGRTVYEKDALPIPELFRRGGDPQLVLITCGGPFDPATRHYRDNVVVIAEPA